MSPRPVGRPKIPTRCPVCGKEMGRAELRVHLPRCTIVPPTASTTISSD